LKALLLIWEFVYHSVWVTLNGGPTTPEVKLLPKHKKNAEAGEKKTVYGSTIIIEQQDAVSFEDQEEVSTYLV
jgi:glutamyl-tRNA synthetase